MFKNVILVCCIVVTLTSCKPDPIRTVMIINNSDEDILWKYSLERLGEWYDSPSISSWLEADKHILLRGDTAFDSFISGGVKDNLMIGWFKYYFFNLDSVRNIPWQRICEERIILKEVRFDSWEDFERCNFEITYP